MLKRILYGLGYEIIIQTIIFPGCPLGLHDDSLRSRRSPYR